MQTVAVVAQRPAEQIDRSVYDVKAEVVTPNASVADVLSNVPNVSVDQDGKVAIRGNQGTKVYVDGKPSAMFSGASAGDALISYPATALEAVEVITAPGAEFGSDGGGGPILNLITRRVQPPGARGNSSVTVGPQGRNAITLSGTYVAGRMQLEGFANVTRSVTGTRGKSTSDSDIGGAIWQTNRDSTGSNRNTTTTLNPTILYNLGDTDRLNAGVSISRTQGDGSSDEYYRSYRDTTVPYEAYWRNIGRDNRRTVYQATLGWERKFSASSKLNIDLRSSASISASNSRNRNSYTITPPADARPQSIIGNDITTHLTELSLDYFTRISPMLNIKAGGKLGRTTGRTGADYFYTDPLTGEEVIDTDRLSGFQSTERSYAAYVSPNVRLSEHWSMLPGLRYERGTRHIDYRMQDKSAADSFSNVLPSMHLQYGWGTQGAAVTAAYSRRITRPSPYELNPNLQYVNDQVYNQGDPHLAPTHNDKYELKYNDTWSWINSNLSLFREKDSPLLGRIYVPVPGSATTINQAVNFGARTNDGISWNLRAKPSTSWRLDGTVSFRRVTQSYLTGPTGNDGAAHALEARRQFNSNSLQLGALYAGVPGHTLQLNGNYSGRQLIGLFESEPKWQVHTSWSWRISPTWSLRAGIRDLFDSNRNTSRVTTRTVRQYSNSVVQGRILNVALSYTFGGVTGDAKLRNNPGLVQDASASGAPR